MTHQPCRGSVPASLTSLTSLNSPNALSPGSFQDQVQITFATWLLRRGAGVESVKELLGHASVATTIDIYGHLTVEDARRTLEAAGWFTGQEVRL